MGTYLILTRRRALAIGVTVMAGWLWAGVTMRLWPAARNSAKTAGPKSTSDDRHLALGQGYLRLHPDEASQNRLARLVPADPVLRTNLVRADFAAGKVVTLGGWVLSRTECRYCALQALALARRE